MVVSNMHELTLGILQLMLFLLAVMGLAGLVALGLFVAGLLFEWVTNR